VHTRSSSGQMALRWRSAGSAKATHLAWNEMEALFQQLPVQLADWYRAANQLARDLNQEEQNARMRLRQVTVEIEASG
jgi:hypothetical protein